MFSKKLSDNWILHTFLVYIIPLSGRHQKENPYWEKGSDEVLVSVLCSFLYIVDMTVIFRCVFEEKMYKKRTFYTYAFSEKYSHYGKNMLQSAWIRLSYALYVWTLFMSYLASTAEVAFYFAYLLTGHWTNYNLILYFIYVHVYISLLSTSKCNYDQPHM